MLYEFTELQLEQDEFNNLIFMGDPPWWTNINEYPPSWDRKKNPYLSMPEGQTFLNSLCYQPLKEVVKAVMKKSGLEGRNPTAVQVFDSVKIIARGETDLSKSFQLTSMPRIWIRNLAPHEKRYSTEKSFYTDDGNHRALVYAMLVACGQVNYEGFSALHATSWDIATGILGHSVQHANNLDNLGKLQIDNQSYTKRITNDESNIKSLIGRSILPAGIQISTFERNRK